MTDQTETDHLGGADKMAEVEEHSTNLDEGSTPEVEQDDEQQETFPREYVEKLRKENAGYRDKAKDRDDLAARLHTSLVAATGRLQDASDLPYDPAHLDDPDALTAALDDLLDKKPHLASRRVSGNVGQGVTGGTESVDLAGILRARAS